MAVMAAPGLACPYEASDEASESELLDRSLSVWRGRLSVDGSDEFAPIPLDLHTASSIGQYEQVRNIIQREDQDLNGKNRGGWTALMYAAYIGHDSVVNLLLDARAHVNIKNNKGQTPLMLAAGSCGNERIAYFLLQQGADMEARDKKGWTALFHATYSGHQNMVKFLLDNKADTEAREPTEDRTPFMVAAAEGHEIIVQYFLQHAVDVSTKARNGDTARSLAFIWGHKKIVSLIDNHIRTLISTPRVEPGMWHVDDLSSSDEAVNKPRRHGNTKPSRKSSKGPSIRDGPEAVDKLVNPDQPSQHVDNPGACIPKGYVTFKSDSVSPPDTSQIRSRDVTSPIDPEDHSGSLDSSGGRVEFNEYDDDTNAFSKTGALTIKSSSSSSGGLVAAFGIGQHSSSTDDEGAVDNHSVRSDPGQRSEPLTVTDPGQGHTSPDLTAHKKTAQAKVWGAPGDGRENRPQAVNPPPTARVNPFLPPPGPGDVPLHPTYHEPHHKPACLTVGVPPLPMHDKMRTPLPQVPAHVPDCGPPRAPAHDLATLLREIGLSKYLVVFEEQDVDLQVFLSLTDNDLKEVGIKLFGPRRKMTNTIARWHSNAPPSSGLSLEQIYADKLEAEMQEMAIQLHQAYEQVEQFKAQVLQERELRSVTEGCLIKMEDRSSRQHVHHLAADTLQCCSETQETIKRARLYTEELSRRRLMATNDTNPEQDCLVKAIHQGLSLEEKTPSGAEDLSRLPVSTLVQRLAGTHDDMWRAVTIATLNVEKLLARNSAYSGAVREGFS